jgi:hypothetical protein
MPLASPHTPILPSKEFIGKTPTSYGDFVAHMDADLGRILDALETHGLARNTLVIFTSDNGPWLSYGEHAGNGGLWDGSLYVFDGRISMDFAPGARQLGTCTLCGTSTNHMVNCYDTSCREQLVCCEACEQETRAGCSSQHPALAVL